MEAPLLTLIDNDTLMWDKQGESLSSLADEILNQVDALKIPDGGTPAPTLSGSHHRHCQLELLSLYNIPRPPRATQRPTRRATMSTPWMGLLQPQGPGTPGSHLSSKHQPFFASPTCCLAKARVIAPAYQPIAHLGCGAV